jgi:hypothetical protein
MLFLTWQVLLAGLSVAIAHVRCSVKQASHVEALLRVLDLCGFTWELSGANAVFLYGSHVFLDSIVDLRVELSVLAHLLEDLVLVCLE